MTSVQVWLGGIASINHGVRLGITEGALHRRKTHITLQIPFAFLVSVLMSFFCGSLISSRLFLKNKVRSAQLLSIGYLPRKPGQPLAKYNDVSFRGAVHIIYGGFPASPVSLFSSLRCCIFHTILNNFQSNLTLPFPFFEVEIIH